VCLIFLFEKQLRADGHRDTKRKVIN